MALTQIKTDTTVIGDKTYLTRHWYMDGRKAEDSVRHEMDGSAAHRIFYAQFVTPRVLAFVKGHFSKSQWALMGDAYLNRGDHYLNDSSRLQQWDQCDIRQMVGRTVTECNYADAPKGTFYWSPSENTCITKEAARMLIESGEYLK
ncbi:hypothetical protein 10P302A_gene0003 [Pseudomonas phage 10P302A]|uniref:Uncharacterized protein n=1 Tax=Pseudomonas phage 10P302A TaxID=3038233 RepID=A0AAF0GP49_9CAUD|nr:hypothetical protein 10P302A_gene0003 [Pseudomonas phage 10P302A]